MVTIFTAKFNIKTSVLCPHSIPRLSIWFPQQAARAVIFLYNTKELVFVTGMDWILCEVRKELLHPA